MRVLWTHNFDPRIPNSGVFVFTAAEGLRARGIDLQLEYLGNLRSVPQLLRARARVRQLAPEFDLVHAQFGSACALATAAVEEVPKVLTIRGSDWNTHNSSLGFLYFHTRLASIFTRAAIGAYDCVISVSRRMAAELAQFAPNALMTVLPSPIDLTRFVPRNRSEAKTLLGYSNCAEKWVLFNSVSLNNSVKRFGLANQAFELAQSRHGNLRLRIATDLSHDVLPLFVAACDVIVCTSEYEGWPNSVKEALACNIPFVATDVSDLRDIARKEPSCRICPPDAQAIADSICDVLAGPEPQGLRQYVSGMGLDAISDQLILTYDSVLSRFRQRNA